MVEFYVLAGVSALVLGAVAKGVVRVVWRRVLRPKAKGLKGEAKVRRSLKPFTRRGARVLNDILLPSRRGTSQIDHVLVSKAGIFVIETKNYSGIVEGTENGNYWRQWFPNSHTPPRTFFNPILQNKGHIQAIKDILKENKHIPIYSLVAFDPKCLFPKLPGVVSTTGLKYAIRMVNSGPAVLNKKQIEGIVQTLEDNKIGGRANRAMHNFRAGLSADKQEVEQFVAKSAENSVKITFPQPEPPAQETPEMQNRHLLTDIYAKLKIRGRTDTIDNFFEGSKRRNDGEPVPVGGNFDYFVCPYTGDSFPPSEAMNFYQGLWITYLNNNPELVSFMKEFGAENLGNSFRCKKVLGLYDADKDALTQRIRGTAWYQNMVQKQKQRSLNTQIESASCRTPTAGSGSFKTPER